MKPRFFLGRWMTFSICITLLFGSPGIMLAQAPDIPAIRLQYATFDPALGEPLIATAQRLPDQIVGDTTHLIQFNAAVQSEWKATLEALGIKIYGYVPDYAFIVRGDSAVIEQARNLPFVRWIGLYHPAYRMVSSLRVMSLDSESGEDMTGNISLRIQTFPDADLEGLAALIHNWGGLVEAQSVNSIDGYLRANLPLERVNDLAAQASILWVEPYYVPQLHNDISTGVIKVTQVRNSLGLYGSGQIIAIADSGLDTGNLSSLHPDIRGRVVGTECLGRPSPCDWSDYIAHGTHVAGSVLGNGTASGSKPTSHQYTNSYAGSAPEAQLYLQSVANAQGSLSGIPVDNGNLMRSAYTHGARIHTNSWGGTTGGTDNPYGGYVITSRQVDQAMWENKDQLILFSAGNYGKDTNKDGVIEPDSIGQPGTAKNILTIGASENNRPTISKTWGSSYGAPIASDKRADKTFGLAAFSSRGPTDDGRIKPDIVAPGTFIASLRSSQLLFKDDLEGDIGNYVTAKIEGGTGDSWQVLTDTAHSPNHYWKQTIAGNFNNGAITALFTPPFDARKAGSSFDISFWHKYNLSGSDQLIVMVMNVNTSAVSTIILNLTGEQNTYSLTRLTLSLSSFTVTPSQVRVGFGIRSGGTSNSSWSIDDLRADGADWGLMSSSGLAQPDDSVDQSYVMMGGTSMATPLTAGGAALVREWLTRIKGVANPSAALIKAVMINGAEDIRPGQYGTGAWREIPSTLPNNVMGWGRLNLDASLNTPAGRQIWFRDNLTGLQTSGATTQYTLTVTPTLNGVFRITLAWTDYPGMPAAAKALVNDLDLEVVAPDGTHYYGNSGLYASGQCLRANRWDACNNVEGIMIANAPAGNFNIIVHGANIAQGPQPFALVAITDHSSQGSRTLHLPILMRRH